MKFKTLDDYYAWTCDWCDSENRTLWVRVANGELTCGACHRPNAMQPTDRRLIGGRQQQMMNGLC
jgi:hypothetical protein